MVLESTPLHEPTALWVIPVAEVGGVARHVLDCAKNGIPGWKMVVLCPPGYLADELASAGVAVVAAELGPEAGMATSVRTVRRVRKSLRPQVVHSHLAFADIAVMLDQGFAGGFFSVSTEHGISGDDSLYQRSKGSALLKRKIHQARMRRTGSVIAVSEATAEAMRQNWRPPTKPTVIPNGADAASKARNGSSTEQALRGPRILSLSRLSPEKNIDILLKAFPQVLDALPEATLTIAGQGPELQRLQELAAELKVENVVTFAGVMDPATAMEHADVLVQLSSWENCSYTILDAVVAGLNVVATDVGGNAEILPDSSLLGEATPHALVEAVISRWPGPDQGPTLPDHWPTVQGMCTRIAKVYASAVP